MAVENGLFMRSREECFFNARTKYFVDNLGNLRPYELMVASRQVFSESGTELSDYSKDLEWRLEYAAANRELFGGEFVGGNYKSEPLSKAELLDSSRRRARRKIFDYCICNDFDLFVTLTLDKNLIERDHYSAVIKKLNNFLGNRVKRKGLRYIGVPELHKNGGLHFHFAMNSEPFKLVDSGTVSVNGRKKPIRVATADRLGISLADRHTVYNVSDWRLGFSTAIFAYGDRGAFAHYLSKELCKDIQKKLAEGGNIEKIGGRWYLHGGDLKKPIVRYQNMNFKEFQGYSYDIVTDGGDFKVMKFDDDGVVIK